MVNVKGTAIRGALKFVEVPEHCHLFTGWIQAMGEGAGASRVNMVKTRCVHRGDPWCEYEGTWT